MTGPGRPRLTAQRRRGDTPREEILDAASELFTSGGYTGTSTRAIADAVGIRQASLYHHFATKDDILAVLLARTVEPALAFATRLVAPRHEGPALPAAARLYALAHFDTAQLIGGRWNLAALYHLPELRAERFADFRGKRRRLRLAYVRTTLDALEAEVDPRQELPFRLVESVIAMRDDGALPAGDVPALIAAAGLRVVGIEPGSAVVAAALGALEG